MAIETIQTSRAPAPLPRNIVSRIVDRATDGLSIGLYSKLTRYGLCRDLSLGLEKPKAKIPISVRPLQPRDLAKLFPTEGDLSESDRKEIAWRRNFAAEDKGVGFVAIDERNQTPCYVQWLFGPHDNAFIKRLKGFPVLEEGQALLENAYTPPGHRGLGIMSLAMALIAERATDFGAQQVFTFVGIDNIASLKGCQRAGFNPTMLHHSVKLGLGVFRSDRFELLPADDPRRTAKF